MRRAGILTPVPTFLLLGGLAALPGCAAAPAINMASQMLMQNQHQPAQTVPTQPAYNQAAYTQGASSQAAYSQPVSSSANPLAILGGGLPSVAAIASLAQHLGIAIPGQTAAAPPPPLITDPYGMHAVPDTQADPPADPPAAARVANATQ